LVDSDRYDTPRCTKTHKKPARMNTASIADRIRLNTARWRQSRPRPRPTTTGHPVTACSFVHNQDILTHGPQSQPLRDDSLTISSRLPLSLDPRRSRLRKYLYYIALPSATRELQN
jgi:hypothetical protein